jgi:hypothetical protein
MSWFCVFVFQPNLWTWYEVSSKPSTLEVLQREIISDLIELFNLGASDLNESIC